MTVYVALLRGVNVGGKNKLSMAELKKTLETLGLSQVRTYIQSGNVLFQSEAGREELKLSLEKEIERHFGMAVPVILRTAGEMKRIVADCPFAPDVPGGGGAIQITLQNEPISGEAVERLQAVRSDVDEFRVHGSEIYFMFRPNVHESKLAAGVQKAVGAATSRNLNTMTKLAAMAEEMNG